MAGKHFLLTHASPASNEEHLTPDTPQSRLLELARLVKSMRAGQTPVKVDAVIFGHSHQAFVRLADEVWFINTGSVGRPDDGDPRACYAVMQSDGDSIQIQHYRLAYDVERAVVAIRKHNLPEAFAQMVIRGYDLDTVLAKGSFKKALKWKKQV